MTRKDFELLADFCKSLRYTSLPGLKVLTEKQRTLVSVHLARALRATNSRFNESRFLEACDIPFDYGDHLA